MLLELSDHSLDVVVIEVSEAKWNRDNHLSVSETSEGLGSVAENEPLLGVVCLGVTSDSEFVLLVAHVLSLVEGELGEAIGGSDLELDSVSQWVSWNSESFGVDEPTLMSTITTVVIDNMVMVVVSSSIRSKAEASWVSNVSSLSFPDSSFLELLTSPLSDDNSLLGTELLTSLVGQSKVSLGP